MSTRMISLETSPDPEDIARVRQGLAEFNLEHTEDTNFTPLIIFLRDEQGKLLGGLLGGTYWGSLMVEIFWLEKGIRRQGFGSRMLKMAEEEALRRGCVHAHLDTIDFQAQGFYEKHGYTVWGVLEGIPPGHRRIFMRKDLK